MSPPSDRTRAPRLDPTIRHGLILDTAAALYAEAEPLLVTFDEIATRAGVSRALVHHHFTNRRDLLDAVQSRTITRLERWVDHGLGRAENSEQRVRALVFGIWSFVESDHDAWMVLWSTGGFDHPNLHAMRRRWTVLLADSSDGPPTNSLALDLTISGYLTSVASWIGNGVDPSDAHTLVVATIRDDDAGFR